MLINEKNKDKIEQMIKETEGRATTRTITFKDIVEDIEYLERTLGIKKVDMVGVKANIDHHAQNFPKAYKYRAESTHIDIERKKSGWDLVNIERWWTRREGHKYKTELTETAETAVLARMSDF